MNKNKGNNKLIMVGHFWVGHNITCDHIWAGHKQFLYSLGQPYLQTDWVQ